MAIDIIAAVENKTLATLVEVQKVDLDVEVRTTIALLVEIKVNSEVPLHD